VKFVTALNKKKYFSFSDRAPSECSWDSNDDELRGSFSTDGDGKHYLIFRLTLMRN